MGRADRMARSIGSINPSTGKDLGDRRLWRHRPISTAPSTAANEAFRKGPWGKMSGTDRSPHILRKLGDLYAASAGRLAELESSDNGMPIRDSRAGIAGHAAILLLLFRPGGEYSAARNIQMPTRPSMSIRRANRSASSA